MMHIVVLHQHTTVYLYCIPCKFVICAKIAGQNMILITKTLANF